MSKRVADLTEYRILVRYDGDEGYSAGIQKLGDGGQWVLVGAELFGPFDDLRDVVSWTWARLSVDLCGSLP